MRKLLHAAVMFAAVALATSAGAEVLVRVEVKDAGEKAKEQPAMSVETLAGAGGQFSTKTVVSNQTVTLKGDLKKADAAGPYRVSVNFSRQGEDGGQQISTSILLALNKPHEIGGLTGAGVERKVILTLEDAPAK